MNHYTKAKPLYLLSGKDKAVEEGARRSRGRALQADREIKAADRTRRDAGLLPHPVDDNDPFAGTEYRPCGPGCWQHTRSAS